MTTPRPSRPLPSPHDPLLAPHLLALREGKLLVQDCGVHGLQWPPREICLASGTAEPAWVCIAPAGFVYTYTISYRAFHPWFADHLPFGVAVVELERGVRMLGGWSGPLDQLRCGAHVVAAPRIQDEVPLLYWTPADQSR